MLNFIANIFGYLLNFLYNIFNNYGVAIIIFTVVIKIIMLPITMKQQKVMEKNKKLQDEMKVIQLKYKNDPDKLNSEMISLYKRENMSPFSGCLSAIVQIILILAVFYLVKSPLTYMKKVDSNIINEYVSKLNIVTNYPEVEVIKQYGKENNDIYLNMNFLGLDLSEVPSSNYKDIKVYVIPLLYVISSIVSMKLTLDGQNGNSIKNNDDKNEEKEETQIEMMQNTNRTMSYMMPIMAVLISYVAPLGLALYWLMNNILMILERFLVKLKFFNKNKEEE